jgi:hypothetical protein
MNDDPIVAEVRRTRERGSRRFNHDIHAIFAELMAREGAEDPSHPLVRNAQEWAERAEKGGALILRDRAQPKRNR